MFSGGSKQNTGKKKINIVLLYLLVTLKTFSHFVRPISVFIFQLCQDFVENSSKKYYEFDIISFMVC